MDVTVKNLYQRIQILAVLAAGLTLYAPSVSADTLAGVVVAADDRPVSGALVAVTDNATGMIIVETLKRGQGPHFTSALTDSAGRFTLDVPPGNYNVLAQQWACLPLNDAISWTKPKRPSGPEI